MASINFDGNKFRNDLKAVLPEYLTLSVAFQCNSELVSMKDIVNKRHSEKINRLSKEQNKPLFNIKNSVKILDVNIPIPTYVMETLSLGPKNPVLDAYDKKLTLVELDQVLEFCQRKGVSLDLLNHIESATIQYSRKCSEQKPDRNVIMTDFF